MTTEFAYTESLETLKDDLRAVRQRMTSLNARSLSLVDKAAAEKRDITASEQREVDSLFSKFEAADREALEIKNQIDELSRTPVPRKSTPNPIAGPDHFQARRAAGPGGFVTTPPRTFSAMFGQGRALADPYGGSFESFGDFARAVASGADSRLLRNAASLPSTTSEGQSAGYLVPTQFVTMLMDEALQREIVRPRANIITMTSNVAQASSFVTHDRTGAQRAGLYLYWAGESTDLSQQKPKARTVSLQARKGAIYCVVSAELAEDAPNFDRQLAEAMTAAVAAGLDLAFINGTGAGQPLGMLVAPATIEVAKESGQAANTLFLQNLSNMLARFAPSSFARGLWLVHPTVLPKLYEMSITIKNVAGTENVGGSSVHPVTMTADGQLRIFGLPAVVTDAVSPLSSRGDIALVDPSRYVLGMRSDVRLARDASHFFGSDEIAYRLTLRVDGCPEDVAPTKLRDGTNTVSPFVVLGAR